MIGVGDVTGCGASAVIALGSVGSCLNESESGRSVTADRSTRGVLSGAVNAVGIASGAGLAVVVVDGGETGGAIGVGCGVGVDTDAGCGAGIASIVCVPASS